MSFSLISPLGLETRSLIEPRVFCSWAGVRRALECACLCSQCCGNRRRPLCLARMWMLSFRMERHVHTHQALDPLHGTHPQTLLQRVIPVPWFCSIVLFPNTTKARGQRKTEEAAENTVGSHASQCLLSPLPSPNSRQLSLCCVHSLADARADFEGVVEHWASHFLRAAWEGARVPCR